LLDRQGQVIRDALLWNDTRSAPDADDLIIRLAKSKTDEAENAQAKSDEPNKDLNSDQDLAMRNLSWSSR